MNEMSREKKKRNGINTKKVHIYIWSYSLTLQHKLFFCLPLKPSKATCCFLNKLRRARVVHIRPAEHSPCLKVLTRVLLLSP